MSDKITKSPQIKFAGFADAWEQRKLGEEFKKVNERNDGSFGKEHWISVAKMYFQDPAKVQSNNIDTRTYVMREGDIAFEGHPNNEFKFGRFVANDIGSGVVSELFPIYRHKGEYDNNYWKHAIQIERIMSPIFSKSITSSGNSSNKLDEKHFLRQSIFVPTIEEQQKIGGLFKSLDNLITLHQQELNNLKNLKASLLQKMFPKNGEDFPEIRFSGFTDAWEQRKVKEVFSEVKSGNRLPKTNLFEGTIPYVIARVTNNGIFMSIDSETKDYHGNDMKLFDVPCITFSIDNPKAIFVQTTSFYTSNIMRVLHNPNLDLDQYYFFLERIKLLTTYFDWSFKFSGPVVMDSEISLPVKNDEIVFEEIKAIGRLFHQLDKTITLHQRELNSLKNLKKSLLQQMFV